MNKKKIAKNIYVEAVNSFKDDMEDFEEYLLGLIDIEFYFKPEMKKEIIRIIKEENKWD